MLDGITLVKYGYQSEDRMCLMNAVCGFSGQSPKSGYSDLVGHGVSEFLMTLNDSIKDDDERQQLLRIVPYAPGAKAREDEIEAKLGQLYIDYHVNGTVYGDFPTTAMGRYLGAMVNHGILLMEDCVKIVLDVITLGRTLNL